MCGSNRKSWITGERAGGRRRRRPRRALRASRVDSAHELVGLELQLKQIGDARRRFRRLVRTRDGEIAGVIVSSSISTRMNPCVKDWMMQANEQGLGAIARGVFQFDCQPRLLIVLDGAAFRHLGVESDEVRLRGLQRPEWIWLLHSVARSVACLLGNAARLGAEIPFPGR
jgi:hypothetical protein